MLEAITRIAVMMHDGFRNCRWVRREGVEYCSHWTTGSRWKSSCILTVAHLRVAAGRRVEVTQVLKIIKEEKRRYIPSTRRKLSQAIFSTLPPMSVIIITQYPYPSSPPIPALLSPTSNPNPLANFLLNAIFKNNSLAKLLVILMNVSELTLPAPTARCKHHNASLMAASSAWRFQS